MISVQEGNACLCSAEATTDGGLGWLRADHWWQRW